MENSNNAELSDILQQDEWIKSVSYIEKKVDDPATSWGELTVLRKSLDDLYDHVMTLPYSEEDSPHKVTLHYLISKVQMRINAEEPQDIKDMRHELQGLGKDVMLNYKKYIQQGEYPKLFDALRRYLEIEYSSKWKAADLNWERGEKFIQRMNNAEENIGTATYEQRKNEGWADLTFIYSITEEQAESLFQYAVSVFTSGDNYMKLAASYVLLWLGS